MSDESKAAKPALPAVAAAPANAPRTVFRVSIGPSPELLQFLKDNPEAKLTIHLPGEPGYDESNAEVRRPAFSMRSWREDSHVCSQCSRPFVVAYGKPPDQASGTHNMAVRCPACRGVVAVVVPNGVMDEAIDVRPGRVPD